MAKIIATTFGAVLILVGLAGLASPTFFGAHCNGVHNLLNLLAGALVVYAAQKAGPATLFWTCLSVGLVFLVLGLGGMILGRPGASSFVGIPPDMRMFVVWPGFLEFGRNDHILNIFFGVSLTIAAVVSIAETPFRLRK